MNILILSQHYWPENFKINEIALSLKKSGCKIHVLTGQPNYPDGKIFHGYNACNCGLENHPMGIKIFRVPLIPRGKSSSFRLIINYLSFVMFSIILGPLLVGYRKYEIIFVYGSSPIFQAIAGILLKPLTGAKLVTWVQDIWPDSLASTGHVRNKWILMCVSKIVEIIYAKSNLILVQSKALIPIVKLLSRKTHVQYFPNPGDLNENSEIDISSNVIQLESGVFNVVFAGNLGYAQALETIILAAEILKEKNDIKITLVGSGSRSEWVKSEINRLGLRNVSTPGRILLQEMPGIYRQASVVLVSLNKNPMVSKVVPSKITSYLAAGLPIIASMNGEGARIINDSKAGIVCPSEDPKELAKAILFMKSLPQSKLIEMGKLGRKYYLENYDPARLNKELIVIFRKIYSY